MFRAPLEIETRRARLDATRETLEILPFNNAAAAHYGRILTDTGFSRWQIFDRMIAAHAISSGYTRVSMNEANFQSVSGLSLLAW